MPDIIAVILAVLSTIIAAIAMALFKIVSKYEIRKMLLNKIFFTGGFLFVFGTMLMILALKMEKLSFLFPLTSLTYIWVMLLSWKYLNESLNKQKIIAIVFIVIGIILVVQ